MGRRRLRGGVSVTQRRDPFKVKSVSRKRWTGTRKKKVSRELGEELQALDKKFLQLKSEGKAPQGKRTGKMKTQVCEDEEQKTKCWNGTETDNHSQSHRPPAPRESEGPVKGAESQSLEDAVEETMSTLRRL